MEKVEQQFIEHCKMMRWGAMFASGMIEAPFDESQDYEPLEHVTGDNVIPGGYYE